MIAPYVTTLESDPHDDDRSLTLTPDDQRAELVAHYLGLSTRDKLRFVRDCSADDLCALAEALGGEASWLGIEAAAQVAVVSGRKHLGNVA